MKVIDLAYQWAEENLDLEIPYKIEPRELTDNAILVDGNTAGALGTIYGGMHFVSWYPITPATSLPEAMLEYAPKLRIDPETGAKLMPSSRQKTNWQPWVWSWEQDGLVYGR